MEKKEKNANLVTIQAEPLPRDSMCCNESECASMMRMLGDENRLRIIRVLIKGPQNVSAISEATGLISQRVSHHLSRMRMAGLVASKRDGRNIIYFINPDIASEWGVDFGCCRILFRSI